MHNFAEYNPSNLVPKTGRVPKRFDDKGGNRFYYFSENGEVKIAAGITTWLKSVEPESKFLTDWKLKFGKDWKKVLNLTADAGTMMHACIEHMLIHNEWPPQHMIEEARSHSIKLKEFDSSVSEKTIEKNLISFQKFREDYQLEPVLIEARLIVSTKFGSYYALALDLLAKYTETTKTTTQVEDGVYSRGPKKGEVKYKDVTEEKSVKKIGLFDFKSNPMSKDKKSFYDSHLYQLLGARRAVHENFGVKVDNLFNWSPNGWISKVGDYTLHKWNFTAEDLRLFELYEELAHLRGAFRPSGSIEVFEKWEPGKSSQELYTKVPYVEYVKLLEKQEEMLYGNEG
jgi:hypothetical protein